MESEKRKLGPKWHEDAIWVKSGPNLAESPSILHPRLYSRHSVGKGGSEAENDGNFRLRFARPLSGRSATLYCTWDAFEDPSGKPTSQCVLMGSGTTIFHKGSEKLFWCRGCASALIICRYSAKMVLIFASILADPSVTPLPSNKCERRRESAYQRSSSHVGAFPPRWAPPASLSPVMDWTPWVGPPSEVERGRTKSVPGGVNPRAAASFALYFALCGDRGEAQMSHQSPHSRGQPVQHHVAPRSYTTCTAPPCQKTPSRYKSKSAPSHARGSGTTLNGTVCRGPFQRVEEFPHQRGSPTDSHSEVSFRREFPHRSQCLFAGSNSPHSINF